MLELGPGNVIAYLRNAGHLHPDVAARAELLPGGVSNLVLRIRTEGGPGFVVKQARRRLRTEADWFSRLDRIWREAEAMQSWSGCVPPGFIPRVLFEDRQNYTFAMEAVADGHVVWKQELLSGRCDAEVASQIGCVVQEMHHSTCSADNEDCDANEYCRRFGDRTVFTELRIDPFYRRVAESHAGIRPAIANLIEEVAETAFCLVHGDLSPKNVLIVRGSTTPEYDEWFDGRAGASTTHPRLTLVDYEVAHFGDAAFDVGFFLSHLMLKAVRRPDRCRDFTGLANAFWHSYQRSAHARWADGERRLPAAEPAQIERRSLRHLAACMLARIDGTSRIDYLPEPGQQEFVRQFSRQVLLDRPLRLAEVLERLENRLNHVCGT
ncbi:MAG TPA: phosphotransferase [Planctomycetaceae bacterium]|nr:phosphotransferase [Planctomycetaceae bacterium]